MVAVVAVVVVVAINVVVFALVLLFAIVVVNFVVVPYCYYYLRVQNFANLGFRRFCGY